MGMCRSWLLRQSRSSRRRDGVCRDARAGAQLTTLFPKQPTQRKTNATREKLVYNLIVKGAPSLDKVLWAYRMLELQPGASLEEVKRAHRELAFDWHPDRPENMERRRYAEEYLKKLNIAYDILSRFHPETDFVQLYEKACVSMSVSAPAYQEPKPFMRLLQTVNVYFWYSVATVLLLWFMIGLAWAVIEDPVSPGDESRSRSGNVRSYRELSVIEMLLFRD